MKNINTSIAIVIGCCIVGVAVIASQLLKQSSIEKQQQEQIAAERAAEYRAEQKEASEAETLSANRGNCLSMARNKYDEEMQKTKTFKTDTCDVMELNSVKWQACLSVVADSVREAEAEHEADQDKCYERFPN